MYLTLQVPEKQMTKFTPAKFKKMFCPRYTENSKNIGQTVSIQMRWLIMSSLIRIYTVGKFNCFMSGASNVNDNLIITCLSLVCVIHCWSCTPTGGATIVSGPIKIICFILRVSAYCGALKVTVICKINVRAGFFFHLTRLHL